MSNAGLFIAGALVTLIVCAALALIIWGIVLDGRYVKEQAKMPDTTGQRPVRG